MPGYPSDVEAIVTFEVDAQRARDVARGTEQRLASVRLLGTRVAVHLERIGASAPPR